MAEIQQLVHKIAVFSRCSIKEVLKHASKFTDKDKKQSSGGALSKEKMFLKILQNSLKNIFSGVSSSIKLLAGNLKSSEAATRDVL